MISQRGFAVKGQKAVVVKIEVISAAGGGNDPVTPPTPPTTGEALWEGSVDMDNWNGMLDLGCQSTNWTDKVAAAFAGLEEGDKFVFTYTDLKGTDDAPAQFSLAAKVGDDWKWTAVVPYDNIPSNGVYVYEVEDVPIGETDYTVLETIPTRGFFIKGQNATITKVELVKKNSAIENVAVDAVDFNAPVEIYTIEGRRVNEMTQGRIYIVRQGNKVVKIAK